MKRFEPINRYRARTSNNNERVEKSPYDKSGIAIEYIIDRERKQKGEGSVGTAVITRRMTQTDAWRCQAVRDIFVIKYISMTGRILFREKLK